MPQRARAQRALAVDPERVALLRLRMRALVGVGGRACVLVALLASPDWRSASSLVPEVGMAKRQLARILAELSDGTLLHARQRGNVHEFRLANPNALASLVALPRDAVFPPWAAIFEWARHADALAALPPGRPASLRVEVAQRKDALLALAVEIGRDAPAASTTEAFVVWVSAVAAGHATGDVGQRAAAMPATM